MEVNEIRYETPLTQYLFQKADRQKIPLCGTFELSPLCNFNCRMCYVRKTPLQVKKHPRKMRTLGQWKDLTDQAAEAGMLYLLLTGGEPFLWPDFWELYEYVSQKGLVVSINTNGSMIDRDAVARLKEMPPSRINVTLYGASSETYQRLCGSPEGFKKVDRAITLLKEAGIQTKLNCSLTPDNAGDLERIVNYAKERGMILEVATYMFPPLRKNPASIGKNERFTPEEAAYWMMYRYRLQYGAERYDRFLEGISTGMTEPANMGEGCYDHVEGRVRCRAGSTSFWATWDGYLLPCGMMTGPKVDMRDKEFKEAWQELKQVTQKIRLSSVCEQCKNQGICHACAAMALAENGEFGKVPAYLCEMMLEMKRIAVDSIKI